MRLCRFCLQAKTLACILKMNSQLLVVLWRNWRITKSARVDRKPVPQLGSTLAHKTWRARLRGEDVLVVGSSHFCRGIQHAKQSRAYQCHVFMYDNLPSHSCFIVLILPALWPKTNPYLRHTFFFSSSISHQDLLFLHLVFHNHMIIISHPRGWHSWSDMLKMTCSCPPNCQVTESY